MAMTMNKPTFIIPSPEVIEQGMNDLTQTDWGYMIIWDSLDLFNGYHTVVIGLKDINYDIERGSTEWYSYWGTTFTKTYSDSVSINVRLDDLLFVLVDYFAEGTEENEPLLMEYINPNKDKSFCLWDDAMMTDILSSLTIELKRKLLYEVNDYIAEHPFSEKLNEPLAN